MTFLIDSASLASKISDDGLRIFDCTTLLIPDPEQTYRVEPGNDYYDKAHIPGAMLLDLQADFSDNSSKLRFTLPSDEAFAKAATEYGISNDSQLVFYSANTPMWATRLWWMFRTFGHEKVSVLDGGLAKWQQEGRDIETKTSMYEKDPTSPYTAVMNPERIASRDSVLEAIEQKGSCIINSLSSDQFRGEGIHYGRPGRIKDSESSPWSVLIDHESGCFYEDEKLREILGETHALSADNIITYCGGGIAASMTLFALALLGYEERVSLYDNSLSEWANDTELPMQTG